MDCKHPYFEIIEGRLHCIVCGKSADDIKAEAKGKVEDKTLKEHETKTWPSQVKRQKKVVKKRSR